MIAPNLIAMGYKKNWIQSLIEQNQMIDIPRILWKQKESFTKTDLDNKRERYRKIPTKLNPSIKPEILEELLFPSKFDTYNQIIDVAQCLSIHLLLESTSLTYTLRVISLFFSFLSCIFRLVQYDEDDVYTRLCTHISSLLDLDISLLSLLCFFSLPLALLRSSAWWLDIYIYICFFLSLK
jgi:hypothetical protein